MVVTALAYPLFGLFGRKSPIPSGDQDLPALCRSRVPGVHGHGNAPFRCVAAHHEHRFHGLIFDCFKEYRTISKFGDYRRCIAIYDLGGYRFPNLLCAVPQGSQAVCHGSASALSTDAYPGLLDSCRRAAWIPANRLDQRLFPCHQCVDHHRLQRAPFIRLAGRIQVDYCFSHDDGRLRGLDCRPVRRPAGKYPTSVSRKALIWWPS